MSSIQDSEQQPIIAGRYRIVGPLGSGGMGTVFLAEQLGLQKRVAIKFLSQSHTDRNDPRVVRFLREGRVSIDVNHPGAAQLLDMGQTDRGQLFLVFEYVSGIDLRQILDEETRLPVREALTIVLALAETLAFAHERGIIHRDVKPENIRVLRDLAGPRVKLLDFGIAKLLGHSTALSAVGTVAGTPRYMPPEQIEAGVVDARSDIYSLGLVFFEMLNGAPAFSAKSLTELFDKQLHETLPQLSPLGAIPWNKAFNEVLQRACAKQKSQRFQSMLDLVRAVKNLPLAATVKRGDFEDLETEPHLSMAPDVTASAGIRIEPVGRPIRKANLHPMPTDFKAKKDPKR
jgi:eukaryotic-like serine/threonine-protein kinase